MYCELHIRANIKICTFIMFIETSFVEHLPRIILIIDT